MHRTGVILVELNTASSFLKLNNHWALNSCAFSKISTNWALVHLLFSIFLFLTIFLYKMPTHSIILLLYDWIEVFLKASTTINATLFICFSKLSRNYWTIHYSSNFFLFLSTILIITFSWNHFFSNLKKSKNITYRIVISKRVLSSLHRHARVLSTTLPMFSLYNL